MAESELADYEYTPWTIDGDQCSLRSDMQNAADRNVLHMLNSVTAQGKLARPRTPTVMVGCDVFEDREGPVLDSKGRELWTVNGTTVTQFFPEDPNNQGRRITLTDLRADLFKLIDATPHLMWLILTKRSENIRQMWPLMDTLAVPNDECGVPVRNPAYRPNVALTTSVSTQADADRNIPLLLQCRDLCPVLGVSAEPLVEAVDLSGWLGFLPYGRAANEELYRQTGVPWLDWTIAGGESGPGARPCRIEWLRDIVEQCQDSGVPVFVKQLGSNPTDFHDGGITGNECPDAAYHAVDPKGGDIEEFPEDLRVREFPVWSREEV